MDMNFWFDDLLVLDLGQILKTATLQILLKFPCSLSEKCQLKYRILSNVVLNVVVKMFLMSSNPWGFYCSRNGSSVPKHVFDPGLFSIAPLSRS